MKRTQKARLAAKRPVFTADDKRRLLNSVEVKERELLDLTAEQKQMKREMVAATPVLAAIIRTPKLWALVPEETREELSRYGDVYC